jgi:hypothetical protein
LRRLKPVAPLLPTAEPELEALTVDPVILGDVRHTFTRFVRNGERGVFVGVATDEELEFAAETLRQYAPLAVKVVPLAAGSEIVRSL